MTKSSDWVLQVVPYDDPTAQLLVAELGEDISRRYGGGDATPVDGSQFDPPHGTFVVVSDARGPIACAGLRTHHDAAHPDARIAELKRMFVRAERRREGHARRLLTALEDHARSRGFTRLILETGTEQPEAIAMYEAAGYSPIPGFGFYKDEPENRCYAKELSDAR